LEDIRDAGSVSGDLGGAGGAREAHRPAPAPPHDRVFAGAGVDPGPLGRPGAGPPDPLRLAYLSSGDFSLSFSLNFARTFSTFGSATARTYGWPGFVQT